MTKLDTWDNQLISLFKNYNGAVTLNKIRAIWAKRCAIDEIDVSIKIVTEYLLDLAIDMKLLEGDGLNRFIFSLDENKNYHFTCKDNEYLTDFENDFTLILLSRLDSLFALTDVSRLPGFKVEVY